MAKLIAQDYNISIGGTDFSSSLAAVTIDITSEEQETTAFGSAWRTRIGGLKDASVSLDFHQDFASGSVDETLWSNLGGTVAIIAKPTSGSATASNPSYSFTALVTQTQPLANSIGDLATMSVTWPVVGEITRGTS